MLTLAGNFLSYDVVDVFTDRAFAGNPLAVVHGADGLDDAQLAALASEFNLSETTFPVPMTDADREAGADYRVRIFTPGGEIPFAGHPTLGTAWMLRALGSVDAGDRVQACHAGMIGVAIPEDPADLLELTAAPRDAARELSPEQTRRHPRPGRPRPRRPGRTRPHRRLWTELGLSPGRTRRVGASPPGVHGSGGDAPRPRRAAGPLDGVDVYAAEASEDRIEVRSRVFVPGLGVAEDPATGSAAAGLGIVLVATGIAAPEGDTAYRIAQGVEMGRPSVLHGRVEAAGGRAVRCRVAGQVRHVASGQIAVPGL